MVAADVPEVIGLLAEASAGYLKDFHPFPFTVAALDARLGAARQDRYEVILAAGEIAGFWMLRGLDAGYARPSFGVFVAEARRGRGYAGVALAAALEHARTLGVEEVMLKVAASNPVARRVYEQAGFIARGLCPETGQDIMTRRLSEMAR